MSSQHRDHLCEIVLEQDFKKRSYGPDTIMLKGHAVTLTFKVATHDARDTSCQYRDQLCKIIIKSDIK